MKSENGNNLGHKRKKAINDESERERAQVSTKISGRTSEREKESEREGESESVSSFGALVLVKSCTDLG